MADAEKINYYKETIDKMEKRLQVFLHESCQAIFTYLRVFGKMTHNEIKNKLDYSRATVFSSLGRLQEAGFVEKWSDPQAEDKRKTYYFAKSDEIEIIGDDDFREYLIQNGKLELYEEYDKNSFTISIGTLKTALRIERENRLKRKERRDLTKEPKQKTDPIIHYIVLDSLAERKRLIEKIDECINEFEQQLKEEKKDYKEPLKNPVAFSLFFVPLG